MKAIHAQIGLACLLLAGVLVPLRIPVARAAGDQLVVVIAASIPVVDISSATLRRVFTGYATELGGKRLIPVNQIPNSTYRTRFDRAVLGLTPDEVGRFWVDRRIRDESPPPRTVPSVELAVRLVASLPGIITYVSADLLNAKVRALRVDGMNPSDPGYPLR